MSFGHVVVWSKPDCPFCSKAKSALMQAQIPFQEMMLNVDFTREQLLEAFPNAKSFPVVVIDGFHIGGYTQLQQKLNEEINNTTKLLNE